MRSAYALSLLVTLVGCTPTSSSSSDKVSSTGSALSGADGTSSVIPADNQFFLTSFGATTDSGTMACGENTDYGSWYYMASEARFGCGAHVQITANGSCVVAEADDNGPANWVEEDAGGAVLDASPLVAEALYGVSSAGWSDKLVVTAVAVDRSTPLGACADSGGSSSSSDVSCYDSLLGESVGGGSCVQSDVDDQWYQCTADGWEALDGNGLGPLGKCTAKHPL